MSICPDNTEANINNLTLSKKDMEEATLFKLTDLTKLRSVVLHRFDELAVDFP